MNCRTQNQQNPWLDSPLERTEYWREEMPTEVNIIRLYLQVVQNMSTWATNIQENWVSYHITREQMGDPNLNGQDKAQVTLQG